MEAILRNSAGKGTQPVGGARRTRGMQGGEGWCFQHQGMPKHAAGGERSRWREKARKRGQKGSLSAQEPGGHERDEGQQTGRRRPLTQGRGGDIQRVPDASGQGLAEGVVLTRARRF